MLKYDNEFLLWEATPNNRLLTFLLFISCEKFLNRLYRFGVWIYRLYTCENFYGNTQFRIPPTDILGYIRLPLNARCNTTIIGGKYCSFRDYPEVTYRERVTSPLQVILCIPGQPEKNCPRAMWRRKVEEECEVLDKPYKIDVHFH